MVVVIDDDVHAAETNHFVELVAPFVYGISYNGVNPEMSIIAGYDGERKIRNIHFENLKINGRTISDDMPEKLKWYKTSDYANIFVGEHVENITFVK